MRVLYAVYDTVSGELTPISNATNMNVVRRDVAAVLKRYPISENPDDYRLWSVNYDPDDPTHCFTPALTPLADVLNLEGGD